MTGPQGRRIALLVANDTYHSPGMPRLYAPVADAQQLRELLRDPEVGGFQPAELLINETKAEIERSLERMFRSAGPDDVVLFYFSGHGIRTRQNLYLATSNTDTELLSSSAVSASFVKELIRDSAAAAKIILLDCCYSGAFLGPDVIKAVPTIDDFGHELASGDGICVLTATTAVQVAEDGSAGSASAPLSVFTSALVRGIGTGSADNGTGLISTYDLWTFASTDVRSRTDRQTPSHYGVLKDEVYIARTRRKVPNFADSGGRVALGSLLGRLEQAAGAGLRAENWWGAGRLIVPIGQQRRPDSTPGEVVWLNFAGSEHNLLIVGRAGTGKSTLLRTLVGSMALTHTPDEVRVLVVESSNRLGSMRDLPHIGEVAGEDEPDRIHSLLQGILAEIRHRKTLYREHNIDSPTRLRAVRAQLTGQPVPDLFLILDRWSDVVAAAPESEPIVRQIAGTGTEYAVHVVATARNWGEVPEWMADLLVTHIELRLHRPGESRIDADRAARLPNGPGWALLGQQPFRVALPDVREPLDDSTVIVDVDPSDGAAELVARLALGSVRPGDEPDRPQAALHGREIDFAALYGITDVTAVDTGRWWRPRPDRRLRVPIGTTLAGEPVEVDLRHRGQQGMGPHGLVVGATGSGKTELLRTVILGLALTHPPAQVNFLLIGFKGGRTYQPLVRLPHLAGWITNLADDLALVPRLRDTLAGEAHRRQELLRNGGNFAQVTEYEAARAAGAVLVPIPTLVIVIEEFMELLAEAPEFLDVLIMVGRLGRSIGMHLLLGTRRLSEERFRGLDSHLSYRIALRTFSPADSRAVLGTADAYHLPATPGHGYLLTGPESTPTRFRTAFSTTVIDSGAVEMDRPFAEALVAELARAGGWARQIWLPPLHEAPAVNTLLPEPDLLSPGNRRPRLRLPIGIVDRPYEQRIDPLIVDLSGAGGNLAVVGGPNSGKTATLRTLMMSAAVTHGPDEVQFYCLDFGGTLATVADLPHIGAMASRRDADLVRRTIAELTALLRRRRAYFRALDIESVAQFRNLKATAAERPPDPLSEDPFGDVFLVVDGWDTIRNDFEALEPAVTMLAMEGLAFGIHLIVTAGRWAEIRPALKDLLGTRLELRLADPADSDLGRRTAELVPTGRPGRGLTPDGKHCLVALPRLDSSPDPYTALSATAAAVRQVAERHPTARAPRVRLLPTMIPREELSARAREHGLPQTAAQVLIGLDENELSPVTMDFSSDPHLMAFAEVESGKTTLLRNIALGVVENSTSEQARIILIDYRRTMLGTVPEPHLAGYSTNAQTCGSMIEEICGYLAERVPGPGITPQQLRERTWWTGPDIYIIVDDHELVATAGAANPLSPLIEYLPQARDIGLHLVVARRSADTSRALHDRVLATLRDLSAATLIMSTPTEEGKPIANIRSQPLPPGRGTLLTRTQEPRLIQIAYLPPP